jgi:hypothetical protein
MPTLVVGMLRFARVYVHAHDKRGHGTRPRSPAALGWVGKPQKHSRGRLCHIKLANRKNTAEGGCATSSRINGTASAKQWHTSPAAKQSQLGNFSRHSHASLTGPVF